RVAEVFEWVTGKFPQLEPKLAWNQPMFTDHGTYIICFSVSKKHMAVAPEQAGMLHVRDDIERAGHEHTKEIVRFRWDRPFDFALIEKMIEFNIADKADCSTFWRK